MVEHPWINARLILRVIIRFIGPGKCGIIADKIAVYCRSHVNDTIVSADHIQNFSTSAKPPFQIESMGNGIIAEDLVPVCGPGRIDKAVFAYGKRQHPIIDRCGINYGERFISRVIGKNLTYRPLNRIDWRGQDNAVEESVRIQGQAANTALMRDWLAKVLDFTGLGIIDKKMRIVVSWP